MIYLDGSASNNDFIGYVISGNRQMSNTWGRYVRGIYVVQQYQTGTRSIISNNHLTACTQYGIYLRNCNAFIAGNNLSGLGGGAQGTGIWLDYSLSAVSNNYVSYFITGLYVAGGVKSGYDNLWCSGVTTNVTDGGTSTVAGTVKDLD